MNIKDDISKLEEAIDMANKGLDLKIVTKKINEVKDNLKKYENEFEKIKLIEYNYKNQDKKKLLPLTKSEKEIYDAIFIYIKKNNYSPSIRELCKLTNKKSTSTVSKATSRIEKKGYIKKIPNQTRNILISK